METLLTIDKQNYTDEMPVLKRIGVRGIIVKDGKLAMQHCIGHEYKIPGGGVDKDESLESALLREISEETGLIVIKSSIVPLGKIVELREDTFKKGQKFIQESYYYFCEVSKDKTVPIALTESEKIKGYVLDYATPSEIYETNCKMPEESWLVRDNAFIKMIIDGTVVIPSL